MRTTLNIDDDILIAVRERAKREGKTAGRVLSELARRGLLLDTHAGEIAESGSFFGFEPLPRRGPTVSNELIDSLRDDEGI